MRLVYAIIALALLGCLGCDSGPVDMTEPRAISLTAREKRCTAYCARDRGGMAWVYYKGGDKCLCNDGTEVGIR